MPGLGLVALVADEARSAAAPILPPPAYSTTTTSDGGQCSSRSSSFSPALPLYACSIIVLSTKLAQVVTPLHFFHLMPIGVDGSALFAQAHITLLYLGDLIPLPFLKKLFRFFSLPFF